MEEIRNKIISFFEDLKFDEKKHLYFLKDKKIRYSVSKIIKNFVEPFDTEKVSLLVSKKRSISQKNVLKEWEKIKNEACEKGNKIHLFGEKYPFNLNLKPENKFEEAIVKFWKDLPKEIVPVMTELQMYHKKYLYAGTADIILYNKKTKTFIIGDYKTNKDLFKNYKGKKMLNFFSDLLDNPFNKYQLQLSFYQILFEQIGLKVSSKKIIWLKPTGKYELYDTQDYTQILKKYLNDIERNHTKNTFSI